MWKAEVGHPVDTKPGAGSSNNNDDWETDPDYENKVTEKEQRLGCRTLEKQGVANTASGKALDLKELQKETIQKHNQSKLEEYQSEKSFSRGYGGKFGVEKQPS